MEPTKEQLIELQEESCHYIGKKFKKSGSKILQLYKYHGIKKPHATKYNGQSGQKLISLYWLCYNKGLNITQTSEAIGLSTGSVHQLCKIHNLPPPRKNWQYLAAFGLRRCYKCHKPYQIDGYQKDGYNNKPYLFLKQKRCRECHNKLMLKRYKNFQKKLDNRRKKVNHKRGSMDLKWLSKARKHNTLQELALNRGCSVMTIVYNLKRLNERNN